MTLLQDYLSLTKQYKDQYGENTIVLMQVGAFFEVYAIFNKEENTITGSSITDFSKICDLNIAEKKMYVDENNVIMAGFSHYMIDKYLKKLQDAGFTIVIYTQDEHNKTNRSLAGIYSPGTFFSTDSSNITNNTTCIWIDVMDTSKLSISKIFFFSFINYPTVPSNFKDNNLSASLENSIGNFVKTSLQNPLISKLIACSILIPLCIK